MKKILFSLVIFLILMPVFVFGENRLDVKIGKSFEAGKEVKLSTKGQFKVVSGDFDEINKVDSQNITVIYKDGKIYISSKNFTMENFPSDGSLLISANKDIKVDNFKISYDGGISFRINDNKLDLINNIDLENYLRGILPKEMSPSFPDEALKAQAVASRSFALANINKYIKKGYNLNDTTACQVYKGKTSYDKKTDAAVKATEGEFLTYDGKICDAIFGASSGGYIADSSEVWGGNKSPYLISKEDPYSSYAWDFLLTSKELNKLKLGNIYTIDISEKDSSGRCKKIVITGQNGVKEMTGNEFRNAMGNMSVKSSLFEIINLGDSFQIKGRGFGHGVGLSQYGAVEMAKQKFDYKGILDFYYPGTTIENKDLGNEDKWFWLRSSQGINCSASTW